MSRGVFRPLRVEELRNFLHLISRRTDTEFREDWRLEDPVEAVLSTCSALLALVNVDDGSPVVQISHSQSRSS